MFKIRHQVTGQPSPSWEVVTLDPSPTAVQYPQRREVNVLRTQDGAVVLQRPMLDSRSRRWLWFNQKNEGAYATLWPLLESFDSYARRGTGLEQTVQIWENTTGAGGFNRGTEASPEWTTVRIIHVDRTPSAAGPVYYPESVVEFYIEDSTYTG